MAFAYTSFDKGSEQIMETSIWFYTFSTAAQVMAALVGLFAVFVVYKIQDFSQLISEARLALSRLLPYVSANTGGGEIRREVMAQMSDKQMLAKFAEILVLPNINSFSASESAGNIVFVVNDTTYTYFSQLVNRKRTILTQLLVVLVLCLGSIAVSLIALAMTSILIKYFWLIYAFLILFSYCLFIIGRYTYLITFE